MSAYCTRSDIELIYGRANVIRWAALDNDESETDITNRTTWACNFATEYVNSRLMHGRYVIPFTSVPYMIQQMAAMYAGILLYDGRSVVSANDRRDEVSRQRKDFDRYIRQIQAGQLKLLDPTTSEALTVQDRQVPLTVSERIDDEEETSWESVILEES